MDVTKLILNPYLTLFNGFTILPTLEHYHKYTKTHTHLFRISYSVSFSLILTYTFTKRIVVAIEVRKL